MLQIYQMRYVLAILLLIAGWSCEKRSITAQEIVDRALEVACSGNCDNAAVSFTFRDRTYKSVRNNGTFQFERITIDSLGRVRDVLTNNGFARYRNDSLQKIADTTAIKYANSVNSVHYFVQLPYGLNDDAVIKELLEETEIAGIPYYKIGVQFKQAGGGTDYQDHYVYWIHKNNFTVDYLAYDYVTDGGGQRFREAYNPRTIEGIRFVDYKNFKPTVEGIATAELDSLYALDQLKLLSTIETENIEVTLLD